MKIEAIYGKHWSSPAQVEEALFLYVDGWHNPRRIQKKLGYRSPEEFEAAWKEKQTTKHEAVPQPQQHGVWSSKCKKTSVRKNGGITLSPWKGHPHRWGRHGRDRWAMEASGWVRASIGNAEQRWLWGCPPRPLEPVQSGVGRGERSEARV